MIVLHSIDLEPLPRLLKSVRSAVRIKMFDTCEHFVLVDSIIVLSSKILPVNG